jgi:hypothetical protein
MLRRGPSPCGQTGPLPNTMSHTALGDTPSPPAVKHVGFVMSAVSPVYPKQQTFPDPVGTSHLCHVWTAPGRQELSSRLQAWSVQPCVRPVGAVRMTAGHNALRGSGPGQKPAFDYALALMGCPDRRIDRLCITCCSPSQPWHFAAQYVWPTRTDIDRSMVMGRHCSA